MGNDYKLYVGYDLLDLEDKAPVNQLGGRRFKSPLGLIWPPVWYPDFHSGNARQAALRHHEGQAVAACNIKMAASMICHV